MYPALQRSEKNLTMHYKNYCGFAFTKRGTSCIVSQIILEMDHAICENWYCNFIKLFVLVFEDHNFPATAANYISG
jgi:hypothetical protein